MSSAMKVLLAFVNVLQLGIGCSLNACVLIFTFRNLKNGLSVNPANLIYTVKGLVNIFLLLVLSVEYFMNVFCTNLFFVREVNLTMTFLKLLPIYYTYWLTGWLCSHYCVNISSFTHPLLVGFRRVLSSFLPRVLLLSTVISFVTSLLSIWEIHVIFHQHPSSNTTQEAPFISITFLTPVPYRLMATLLGCCLPFTLALSSIGFTTSSLIGHMKKMKQNFSGSTCPNLQVLINTTRTMILFLTLSVTFYIFGLLLLTNDKIIFSAGIYTINGCLPAMAFPLTEAAIIIQAIPKLRKMISCKVCGERQ